jgi:hypothetical protein
MSTMAGNPCMVQGYAAPRALPPGQKEGDWLRLAVYLQIERAKRVEHTLQCMEQI